MTKTQRVVGYVRVSDAHDPTAPSLDSQEAALRDWCAARDCRLVRIYRESHSGVEFHERPELQRLLADAARDSIDLVLFYSFDRISRDPEHQIALRVILAASHARLACVTRDIPSDRTGALLSFVEGYAANVEWEQIRERTLRGKRARALSGKLPGSGVDLYGYVKDRRLGRRSINEGEAAVVPEVYARVASGESLRQIARDLNRRGVPPPSYGKTAAGARARWAPGILRRIVTNPEYAGHAYAWKHRWDPERKRMSSRAVDEWIALPEGVTPALVDDDLWQQANEQLRRNVGDKARALKDQRQYLLRGHLACGWCGRRLYSDVFRARRVYRCAGRRLDDPDARCRLPAIDADTIEGWVWQRVRAFMLRPQLLEEERARLVGERHGDLDAAIAASEARLAAIVRGQARVLREFRRSEVLRWELVEAELAAAERERQDEEQRLIALRRQQAGHAALLAGLDRLETWRADVAQTFDEQDFLERREVLQVLSVRVVVMGRDDWRLEPDWLVGDLSL